MTSRPPSAPAARPLPEPSAAEAAAVAGRWPVSGRLGWRLAVSLSIAAFFVWLLHAGAMPLVPAEHTFARVRWWTFGAYLVGWSVVHVLRAARWKLLLAPLADVSLTRVFIASFIGFFAIVMLPLRAGEVVRALLIRERGRVSAWAAAGTLGAERIVDGLTSSVILFVALGLATPLDPLPEQLGDLPVPVALVPGAARLALLAFLVAFLLMIAFYVWEQPMRRLIGAVLSGVSPRLADAVAARIGKVAQGLRFLSNLRQSVPFVALTALYWLLNAACAWVLGWGVGLEQFSYAEACVVTGVLALGVLMPNAPGFFGAFQVALYAALAMFYPRERVLVEGAAFVFLVYLAQNVITGGFAAWAAFAVRSASRAEAEPVTPNGASRA